MRLDLKPPRYLILGWSAVLIVMVLLLSGAAFAQEEVASAFRRYKESELSTGFYEEYEVKPRGARPIIAVPGVGPGVFTYHPTVPRARIRTRLADSHLGIKFYHVLRCDYCHVEQTTGLHTVRAGLTCRQCHGGEPIASIDHYFSPMNPIRRHAYICAKCHEGSSASFASYVIHPPNPANVSAMRTFPILFFVFWFMVVLAVGTFLVFLPHTALWGIRELLSVKKKKKDAEPRNQ